MQGLKREKVRGKSRPQRRKQSRTSQAALQRPLENEEHCRRRHIAVAAQDFALVAQRAFLQLERNLDCVEDLCAARMTDKLGRL